MSQPIVMKGNKYGITIRFDETTPFEELRALLKEKLVQSSDFFQDARMALAFEGRHLTKKEEEEVLDLIETYSELKIVCIMDHSENTAKRFAAALALAKQQIAVGKMEQNQEKQIKREIGTTKPYDLMEDDSPPSKPGQFYRGTLRGGQILESEKSIVIVGNVNPGGKVIARGNIVILGTLKGSAFAGCDGKRDAFIAALNMVPTQLRIHEHILNPEDRLSEMPLEGPRIAMIRGNRIQMDLIQNAFRM
ncbi:MAG TPA: septum site-determining protein MinC [Candidatus Fimimorpha excrementavium]|nr:septum site-determining protein MinC [Candidatus Fimimorpha excrementavium]